MTGRQTNVSVIIPHYRELKQLDVCLALLQQQTYPKECIEVIVADNNSPEGPAALEAVIAGRAKLVTVVERGAGCARNGGVAAATGDILAFTDSDCVPEPGWIEEGVKALEHTDIVGGRMVVHVEDPDHMTACEGFEVVFAFNNKLYIEKRGFTVTANLFCRRSMFDEVGGFLSAGIAEDFEWCRRAAKAGHALRYAPLSVVGHPARRTWPALLKKWQRLNQERFGFLCQVRRESRALWIVRNCALPLSALAHSPKVLRDRRLKSVALRLAVVATLFRLRLWRLYNSIELAIANPGDKPA